MKRLSNDIIIVHPVLFSRLELKEYEECILANPEATERDASKFFERFPQFLYMGQADRVRREVLLISATGDRVYRVDFFRHRYGDDDWDIVELKGPRSPFVVGNRGHYRPSATVTQAIHQAEDYRDLIVSDPSVRLNLKQHRLLIRHPRIVVIAGQEHPNIDPETLYNLRNRIRRGGIDVWSYTAVFEFAKDLYKASGLVSIPALWVRSTSEIVAGWSNMEAVSSSSERHLEIDLLSLQMMIPDAYLHRVVNEKVWISSAKLAEELALSKNLIVARIQLYRSTYGYDRSRQVFKQRLNESL